jgi:hypothetical protein
MILAADAGAAADRERLKGFVAQAIPTLVDMPSKRHPARLFSPTCRRSPRTGSSTCSAAGTDSLSEKTEIRGTART